MPASPFSVFGGSQGGIPGYYSPGAPSAQPVIEQNLAAGPQLAQLTSLLNQINQAGQSAANLARIPGEAGLEEQSSANIGSQLQGQLPPDVMALLAQQGAERGIATGAPGSANANAAYLRALGLTSLQQQEAGQRNLSAAVARNPLAPLANPEQQLFTPAQAGQLQLGGSQLGLDWYNVLNRARQPMYVSGGGGAPRGGGYAAPAARAPDTSWADFLYGGGDGTMVAYGPGGGPDVSAGFAAGSMTGPMSLDEWVGQFEQYPGELTGAGAGGGGEEFTLPYE